uniref:Uncharacterized protein n=1 Tax=Heterorhabditis bacteriophora TaxID=37862 RepID=A0A1I7WV18_HETBA
MERIPRGRSGDIYFYKWKLYSRDINILIGIISAFFPSIYDIIVYLKSLLASIFGYYLIYYMLCF